MRKRRLMSLGGKPRSGGQGLGLERGGGGGGRVSSRGGGRRRHAGRWWRRRLEVLEVLGHLEVLGQRAAGAVVSARLLLRRLLPPFKRELECDAAALDEAEEVVAPPQLGRSQDLVEEQGGVAPPTPPSHRPCRPTHRPLPLHRARQPGQGGCRRGGWDAGGPDSGRGYGQGVLRTAPRPKRPK